jgi:uncharacterized protein YigE (DUF2233 family)
LKICLALLLLIFSSKSYCHADFIDFTINPSVHQLELRLLDKKGKPLGSFTNLKRELADESKELIFAMNAGIFMQNQMPLGLYIENGKTYRKLNTRKHLYGNFYLKPNGVFLISNGTAHILETGDFKTFANNHHVEFATQSGPLLLIASKDNLSLSKYDNNKTIRNAVCVDAQSKVKLSISKRPVSFSEMTSHLKKDNHCYDALYLDGAISGAFENNHQLESSYQIYGPMIAIFQGM